MTSTNDKLRTKMAKENLMQIEAADGLKVYDVAANAHLDKVAYAPDMVKWTKKDIRKLMAEKKATDNN